MCALSRSAVRRGDRAAGMPGARRTDARWGAAAAVAALLVFLLVRRSLIDDAYITLSYARNLAEHLHWGLTPARSANSATSPLNVLVLGAATFVVRDAVAALGMVFVLLTGAQGWGLSRLARDLRLGAPAVALGTSALLFSPLTLSIVGMEMTLGVALLVWLTVAAVEGRPVAFGLLAAALVLTRVDLAVFPLVLLVAVGDVRRRAGRVLLVAATAAAPWYVVSWVALGALVPDTLVIKTVASGGWDDRDYGNGPLLYLDEYPVATLLTAAPVVVGLLAVLAWFGARAWRQPRWVGLGVGAALGVAGILHAVAYVLLAPPPFHWYYAPPVAALTLVATLAAGTAGRAGGPPAPAGSPRPAGWRVTAGAAAGALMVLAYSTAALRPPLPWDEVPITTNWATAEEYRTAGEGLAARLDGETVRSPGEVGALAYHCRCDIVDTLSDRGMLPPVIDERVTEAGPVMQLLLRVNFANFTPPAPAAPTRALVWVSGQDARAAPWPVHSRWRSPGALDLVPVPVS